jgi:hypothetical protein
MTRPAPLLRTVLPGVAAEVEAVVDRALAYRREDRWQDARAMQIAVRRATTAVRSAESQQAASGWRIATPVAFRRPGEVRGAKVEELSFDDAETEVRMEPPETERSARKSRLVGWRGAIVAGILALAASVAVCEAAPRSRSGSLASPGSPPVTAVEVAAPPSSSLSGVATRVGGSEGSVSAPAPPATGVPEGLAAPVSGLQVLEAPASTRATTERGLLQRAR